MSQQTQEFIDASPLDRKADVERLEKEIGDLHKQQTNNLENATYLGMTPDDEKEYDARCSQMGRLWRQLSLQLQRAE